MNQQHQSGAQEEFAQKLASLRARMVQLGIAALRLRGVDWFSWLTCGGSSVVILTAEEGIAEALVTAERFLILTNVIEADRLRAEELPSGMEITAFRWDDLKGHDDLVRDGVTGTVASDRPRSGEVPLPKELIHLRLVLSPTEVDRYRQLGRESAEAMREALTEARPDWSENRLAGEGARRLWERGIHATLILVAGERRLPIYRHPLPTAEALGGRAMMVFCARRHGLYANLTRFVYFRAPSAPETHLHAAVAEIEAAALEKSRPGVATGEVFEALHKSYADNGFADEILKHHQGGLTGYLSREEVAVGREVRRDALVIGENSALAWNPSLPGVKTEDTVLARTGAEPEILTAEPLWPTVMVHGRRRPDILLK